MRLSRPLGSWVGTTVVLAASVVLLGSTSPAVAADGDDCTTINQVDAGDNDVTVFAADGSPAQSLRLAEAQRRVRESTGRSPGDGVTVAVLDSGVRAQAALRVEPGSPVDGARSTREPVWHQGTLLAGVIAAAPDPDTGLPVGVAPGATIVDQRIYDTALPTDDALLAPGPESVAAGLEAIAPRVGPGDISIVVVAVASPPSARLEAAVERVTRRGAIVVAASPPRPDSDSGAPGATYRDGEDFADLSWPAGYSRTNARVVTATTTAASPSDDGLDPADFILFSSAIDVAVPTAGAVSLGLNGRYCSIVTPSPAVAAAEVAGILALLQTAFPGDRPQDLIARLETTASGASSGDPALPDTREGRGVAQPLEALTRPLLIRGQDVGRASEAGSEPAVLPVADPDVLASTRDRAVWWGLLGGGALVVLLIVRPVLARRH